MNPAIQASERLGRLGHWMVLADEEHLRNLQGGAYARCCKRVPRYLGFLRRDRYHD